MMFVAKMFDELLASEIYEILKSRTEIFLLEQNIICQDMDDIDYRCLHCFFWSENRVIAYLRAYKDDCDEGAVVVGRVLTLEHNKGLGKELMEKSMKEIKNSFGCKKIKIHAQTQAMEFYRKLGFVVTSDEFMEEGVPHISMELDL